MWRKIQKFLATVVPILLLIGYITVAVSLLNRWDSLVPVTLIPVWAWAGAGILISLLCWIVCRGWVPGALFCLFLISGVVFSEETVGIFRELAASIRKSTPPASPETKAFLRIVNVDCAGTESALRKAAESEPDIIVIRRAPEKAILESVADQLYGVDRSVSVHKDLAILARGETLAFLPGAEDSAIHVRLMHPVGLIIDITGVDLDGCAPRQDMWKPSVWEELISARVTNRRLVRTHLGENEIGGRKIGRIVAGGFGTPPGDDVYRPLESNDLIDTFDFAGMGWGNTFPADYPVLRLDQIWVSSNLLPVKSETRLNPAPANRIVVSDLRLPEMGER